MLGLKCPCLPRLSTIVLSSQAVESSLPLSISCSPSIPNTRIISLRPLLVFFPCIFLSPPSSFQLAPVVRSRALSSAVSLLLNLATPASSTTTIPPSVSLIVDQNTSLVPSHLSLRLHLSGKHLLPLALQALRSWNIMHNTINIRISRIA